MKALVTGGGGFLGRHIVEQLLDKGDEVAVFARSAYPQLGQIGASLIQGDIQNGQAVSQACAGVDAVFHVAAKAGYWGSWESFYQPNVVGTRHVIEACRKQGVRKLIYTSTPSVVANSRSREGANESLPYPEHFESYYPHTKALAEQMVKAASDSDLLTVSLRPHLIWGPRDTQLLAQIFARAREGRLFQVGDGTNLVDVTYIDDAARAHLLAADALAPGSPAAGSVYFISQDEPVNTWDWVNSFLVQLDMPPIKRQISLPLARALGGMLEFVYHTLRLKGEPRVTRFLANEMALSHYYDISRAKSELGYEPQISMDEGVRRTVAYFKEVL